MLISSVRHSDILHLTFSDPTSRNALSLRAARELRAILQTKDFSAVIFEARGRVFCSGGHLSDYASMTSADEGRSVNDEIRGVLASLSTLDRPTVAAVGGDVFGGGLELLSCFDSVISVPHAMFAFWQRKLGLSYGWGGGARLEKRIGPASLRRLSLSTQTFSAQEALALGLIDRVVQDSMLVSVALAEAIKMTKHPAEPVTVFKNFAALSEASDFNSLWWNPAHKSALAPRKR
jgi:enoyl-CoA hydratase